MKVRVGVSQRHVHLTKEDVELLFGKNYTLTKKVDLYQPGQYSCEEQVIIKGPKGTIENVRVLGPERENTQVEISKTDTYKLGSKAPIRNSGDLSDASEITIIGPKGIITKKALIIATRHIHVNTKEALEYGFNNNQLLSIIIGGEKPGRLDNVYVRVDDSFKLQIHLDTDDANAFLINNDDVVEIVTK